MSELPVNIIHKVCGGIAFVYCRRPARLEVFDAKDAMQLRHLPKEGSPPAFCDTCGHSISLFDVYPQGGFADADIPEGCAI